MRLAGAVAGAVLLASLAACGGGDASDSSAEPGKPAGSASASASAGTAAAGGDSARDEFLRLTAAHICTVQGTVYDDPAALAAAYDEAPDYPSLSDAQAAAFSKKVTSDPDFSALLLAEVSRACGG